MKKHLIYWLIPTLFTVVSMCIYFFDIFGLSFIIAPEYNREFGIIENAQLVIILGMLFMAIKYFKITETGFQKFVFISVALGSIFLFMEEIDYGLHISNFLEGKTAQEIATEQSSDKVRNFHNNGRITHYMKVSAYVMFIILLVIFPIAIKKTNIENKAILWLVPSKNFIYTLLAMVLLNQVALYIDKNIADSSVVALNSNISEFEEVFVYYIMLIYFIELIDKLLLKNEKNLILN